MKNEIQNWVKNLMKNSPPDIEDYKHLINKIDFSIDKEFLEFIRCYNGASGILGESNPVEFHNVEDLISLNPYMEDVERAKMLFFFGSDGSSLGYAFNKNNGKVVSIHYMDISDDNEPLIPMGDSFESFLEILSQK